MGFLTHMLVEILTYVWSFLSCRASNPRRDNLRFSRKKFLLRIQIQIHQTFGSSYKDGFGFPVHFGNDVIIDGNQQLFIIF